MAVVLLATRVHHDVCSKFPPLDGIALNLIFGHQHFLNVTHLKLKFTALIAHVNA